MDRSGLSQCRWPYILCSRKKRAGSTSTLITVLLNAAASHRQKLLSNRGREVRKHVGDYTLFMTGLFPENVGRHSKTRRPQTDPFVDFVQEGKESYSIVSCFDQSEHRAEAPLGP